MFWDRVSSVIAMGAAGGSGQAGSPRIAFEARSHCWASSSGLYEIRAAMTTYTQATSEVAGFQCVTFSVMSNREDQYISPLARIMNTAKEKCKRDFHYDDRDSRHEGTKTPGITSGIVTESRGERRRNFRYFLVRKRNAPRTPAYSIAAGQLPRLSFVSQMCQRARLARRNRRLACSSSGKTSRTGSQSHVPERRVRDHLAV